MVSSKTSVDQMDAIRQDFRAIKRLKPEIEQAIEQGIRQGVREVIKEVSR